MLDFLVAPGRHLLGTYLRARFRAARLHPLRCWECARKYVPAQLNFDAPLCSGIASLINMPSRHLSYCPMWAVPVSIVPLTTQISDLRVVYVCVYRV